MMDYQRQISEIEALTQKHHLGDAAGEVKAKGRAKTVQGRPLTGEESSNLDRLYGELESAQHWVSELRSIVGSGGQGKQAHKVAGTGNKWDAMTKPIAGTPREQQKGAQLENPGLWDEDKGAVSARVGERLLIPMNMRDGSLLCVGRGERKTNAFGI